MFLDLFTNVLAVLIVAVVVRAHRRKDLWSAVAEIGELFIGSPKVVHLLCCMGVLALVTGDAVLVVVVEALRYGAIAISAFGLVEVVLGGRKPELAQVIHVVILLVCLALIGAMQPAPTFLSRLVVNALILYAFAVLILELISAYEQDAVAAWRAKYPWLSRIALGVR